MSAPERSSTWAAAIRGILRLLGCAALLAVASRGAGLAHAAENAELLDRVDRYVEDVMRADRVPGVALAIVKDGAVVHERGFGLACPDGRPVDPRTPFVLGSMSKSITAVAVMQLVEGGKVELDAPAKRYLPWFAVADEAASAQISVRHLLHHTSGFPTRTPMAGAEAELEGHVRALGQMRLASAPGKVHRYSSANYQVLGLVVETVSGEPFGAYVRRHIFEPLAMTDSRDEPAALGSSQMACGHRYWAGFPLSADLPHDHGRLPTAALISTARDLARFTQALLGGGQGERGRVLSAESVRELLHPVAQGEGFSYAMGWRVGPIHRVPAIHHGGIVDHFRGKMVLLPEHDAAVVVLTNASGHIGRVSSHLMANGVAAMLAGKSPPPARSLALSHLLGGIAIALLLLTAHLIKEALTLRRWTQKLAAEPPKSRWARAKAWGVLGWGALTPPLVLLGLPAVLQLSWGKLVQAMPDVALWMLIYLPAACALACLKASRLRKILQKKKPSEPSPAAPAS